jgi:hypothetical protein
LAVENQIAKRMERMSIGAHNRLQTFLEGARAAFLAATVSFLEGGLFLLHLKQQFSLNILTFLHTFSMLHGREMTHDKLCDPAKIGRTIQS